MKTILSFLSSASIGYASFMTTDMWSDMASTELTDCNGYTDYNNSLKVAVDTCLPFTQDGAALSYMYNCSSKSMAYYMGTECSGLM